MKLKTTSRDKILSEKSNADKYAKKPEAKRLADDEKIALLDKELAALNQDLSLFKAL